MPVYNDSNYFKISLDSILNQSYSNLEIIIIDDSDNDLVKNIVLPIKDNRIRYFSGNRMGLPAARNLAVSIATGKYIANMDADDISEKNRIELQIEYLKKYKLDICGSWIKFLGRYDNRVICYPEYDADIKFCMLTYSPLANPTILCYAEILKDHPYNETVAEDYDLWTRLAGEGYIFGNISSPLLMYRLHSCQTSVVKYEKMIGDALPIIINYSKFFLNSSELKLFSSFTYGQNSQYTLHDVIALCKTLITVAKDKNISDIIVVSCLVKYFRKTHPLSMKVFFAFIKLLLASNLPIFTIYSFNILVISFFRLNRKSKIFLFLKKFSR